MGILEAALSGIVQGLTEFLPVSSSGHLVFVHAVFGKEDPKVFFDVCLHFATMASVVIFFRKEILGLFTPSGREWRKYILIGTIPAALAGILFEKHVANFFVDPRLVSGMLILTAAVLIPAQVALSKKGRVPEGLDPPKAWIVGLAQGAAIIPGLSRSGLTISAGLVSGVDAERSFRFAFLLSIPIVSGAVLYKVARMAVFGGGEEVVSASALAVGMGFAFLSGLLGLFFLKRAVMFKKIWIFSVYCFIVGSAGLIIWR